MQNYSGDQLNQLNINLKAESHVSEDHCFLLHKCLQRGNSNFINLISIKLFEAISVI